MKKILLLIICSLIIVTGCQNKNNDNENKTTTTTTLKTSLVTTTSSKSTKSTSKTTTKETIKTNAVENPTTTKNDKTSSTKTTTTSKKTSTTTTSKTTSTTTSKATTTTTVKPTTTTTTTTKTTLKVLSEQEVYQSMVAKKAEYPNGMSWTNDNCYSWKGGIYSKGCGCVGFAFILSDAAFGTRKAKKNNDYNNIKVGDIVRLYNDTHSVIILEVHSDYYIVAEGNINASIYWGRKITKDELISSANYVLTRY